MVFTFATTGNSAFHNGQNLELKLALQTADTLSTDTSNLSVVLTNLTTLSENPTVLTLNNWQLNDIFQGKYPNYSINDAGTVVTLNLPLNSSIKSVQVVAKENDKNGNELPLLNTTVNIKARPSTPILSVKSAITFGLNTNGNGVVVTGGTLSVTPAYGEGTTKILLCMRGVNPSGSNFSEQVSTWPVPTTGPTTVNIQLNAANLFDMQADSTNYLCVQSENDQGESDYSNSISFEASVRQVTPTLLTAKSLENAKVTVTGSLNPVNAYYSVLASTSYNPSDPQKNWYQTNITNVAITTASQPAFTQSVTQFKGAALNSGQVYNFVVIQHASQLLINNNEVAVDPSLAAVPLTQSTISAVLSAVPVTYVPSSVDFDVSSQSYVDSKLIFAPTISNAVSIPPNMNAFFDFKISGVSRGEIKNATNNYAVPSAAHYTVSNPVKGAQYVLSLKLDYMLTTPQVAAITGTAALAIYTDPSTGFKYASVFSQSKTVTQNPSEDDVPLITDLSLGGVTIGQHMALSLTHVAPSSNTMNALGVSVQKYEIQLIKGNSGNPSSFPADQLIALNADGTKTLTVAASSPSNIPNGTTDAPEYHILKQYLGGAVVPATPGHYCAQIRSVFNSNSGIIYGKYQPANFEMLETALSAPASVTVSSALGTSGSTGSSVSVSYQAVQTSAVVGKPTNWSGLKAVAAICSLLDKDGKIIAGPATKSFTAAELAANPSGDVMSSMNFSGLTSGTLLYGRVKMVYQRLSAVSELMPDVKDGSTLQSALYAIKSDATIASVKLSQTPFSSNPRGIDSNGGTSYKVTVIADVGNNDPNSLQVKAVAPAVVAGVTHHVHDLAYDSAKKEWSVTLSPVANYDYAKNQVHVFLISAHNVDSKSY